MDDDLKTPFSRHPWIALLIGLADETARECATAAVPLPIVRVANAVAAMEWMTTATPLIVVAPNDASAPELALVRKRASELSAVVVGLDGVGGGPLLATRLKEAILQAERLRVAGR